MECASLYVIPSNGNRDLLDFRMLHFNVFVGSVIESDGSYEVRCIEKTSRAALHKAEAAEFMITHQGYGKVVARGFLPGEREELYNGHRLKIGQ